MESDGSFREFSEAAAEMGKNLAYASNVINVLKYWQKDITINYELSKTQYIETLNKTYDDGKLVLVLGSGISTECGLPDWDTLLQKLLLKIEFNEDDSEDQSLIIANIYNKIFNPSNLISGRYIRNNYQRYSANNKNISFEEFVRNSLYEEKINDEASILKEIFQFCIGGHGGPTIDSIITYNFDDLLERYLDRKNIPFKAIYSEGMSYTRRQTPIYHVHGFLPRGVLNKDHKIILSEDMYHLQYNDIYSWSNLLQINTFKDKTCLFIGFSLIDPNSRRLLDIAMKQRGNMEKYHFLIRKRIDKNNVEKNLKILLQQDAPLCNEQEHQGLEFNEVVERLIKIYEKFLEEDAFSLGIRTIWINNYEEIPKILKDIRVDNI